MLDKYRVRLRPLHLHWLHSSYTHLWNFIKWIICYRNLKVSLPLPYLETPEWLKNLNFHRYCHFIDKFTFLLIFTYFLFTQDFSFLIQGIPLWQNVQYYQVPRFPLKCSDSFISPFFSTSSSVPFSYLPQIIM